MLSQKRKHPRAQGPAGRRKPKRKPKTVQARKETRESAPVPAATPVPPRIVPSALMKNLPDLLPKSPSEMRSSINNVREWSSQMRTTMLQVEQTLSTLHGLVSMYERWNAGNEARQAARIASGESIDRTPISFIRSLRNVDFSQMFALLNSPLVQALLELDDLTADEEENASSL